MVTPGPTRHRHSRPAKRRTRNAPVLAVLVLATAGLAYVAFVPRHWLRGVLALALALALAGVLRIVLPTRRAGALAVRSRFVDTVCYLGVAAAMAVFGLWLRATGAT